MTYDSPELRYELPTEYDEEGKLVYGLIFRVSQKLFAALLVGTRKTSYFAAIN